MDYDLRQQEQQQQMPNYGEPETIQQPRLMQQNVYGQQQGQPQGQNVYMSQEQQQQQQQQQQMQYGQVGNNYVPLQRPATLFSNNYMQQQNSQTDLSTVSNSPVMQSMATFRDDSVPELAPPTSVNGQSSPLQRDGSGFNNFQQQRGYGMQDQNVPGSPTRDRSSNNRADQAKMGALSKDGQDYGRLQNSETSSNQSNSNGSIPSNYVFFERHPEWFSRPAQDRSAAVKLTLENYYKTAIEHAIERNQRRIKFEQKINGEISAERRNRETQLFSKNESHYLRLRRTRLSLEDFHTVKVIGKGAFGEVRLVQKRDTGKIYAMKTLLKSEMYKKDQLAHVKAERDVLADANSPWVVSLYYSFQDPLYLYLIMEFLPGGDLMTMLIKWQIFTEDVTRFYIAECVLAIEAIHKLGFIQRDIKPDNILIDRRGHIKLSDFGLSTGFHKTHDSNYYKKLMDQGPAKAGSRNSVTVDSINLTMTNRQQMQTWRKSRRLMAYSTVGTPDYIAPEIFVNKGYGQECDWWSLGAIMFECLVGWPPFCSETPAETYRKIMNWRETLQFPDDVHLSPEAEDLILRLLTDAEHRLGIHGAEEIKRHPFFRGVNWDEIRNVEAPFIPKLRSITDTRFFPTDELDNVPDSPALAQAEKERDRLKREGLETKADLPFIGYTYSRFEYLTKSNAL